MISSIELWLRFIAYALTTLTRFGWPLTVRGSDLLARELYSGHVKKSGALKPNAFLINAKSEFGISVNRWSLAPERLFVQLGLASARRRKVNFKGFAEFRAASLETVALDDSWQLRAVGAPTFQNAFHADIPLPPDKDEDYYLFVATELVDKAKPVPYRSA